ncbi:hypothetical protein [Archangium lipolyticum]|uniref:hypothetical protein n=1 Tax=Archangium lipolyticum TaxID=2970465 RepID=UPI00214A15D3|nr:hypothetical protein [Archangium lipolyticum]
MSQTVTIILSIDPNDTTQASARYSPGNQVEPYDSVVFTVQGSSQVFTVTFPEGSPFDSGVSSLSVGGTTLAAQSSPPEKVARVPLARYRFVAVPEKSSTSGNSVLETPGTVAGDLEVVPESGGNDPGRSVVVMPFPQPPPEPVLGEPVLGEPVVVEVLPELSGDDKK